MSLLAEELVEEWLNRQGYFTIRGAKIGNHEIDLLAIKPGPRGLQCRQVEVQASVRPISYISKVPREVQKTTGRGPGNAKKRTPKELRQGVQEWVHKKYHLPEKQALRTRLAPGKWACEMVVNVVRHEHELELFASAGVTIHRLPAIMAELNAKQEILKGASGESLVDLASMGSTSRAGTPSARSKK